MKYCECFWFNKTLKKIMKTYPELKKDNILRQILSIKMQMRYMYIYNKIIQVYVK